jgi:hypothetical protein
VAFHQIHGALGLVRLGPVVTGPIFTGPATSPSAPPAGSPFAQPGLKPSNFVAGPNLEKVELPRTRLVDQSGLYQCVLPTPDFAVLPYGIRLPQFSNCRPLQSTVGELAQLRDFLNAYALALRRFLSSPL